MPEKSFEFILIKKENTVAFNLSFVLLLAKIDFILEEQNSKENAFRARSIGCLEKILTLLTKIISLYIQDFIVYIEVMSFIGSLSKGGICFATFLALNKQF